MKNCRLKSWPVDRWRSFFLSVALLAAGTLAVHGRSFLLEAREPRDGLLRDADDFARLGDAVGGVPGNPVGYAEFLGREWTQVRAEGREPRLLYFFCTVYYTVREEAFTAERHYDMTLETRSTLRGKKFPASFMRAVVMEGFGRMRKPVDGKHYLKYDGTWGFGSHPLGNRNNRLRDRASAAVHRKNAIFSKGTRFLLLDPGVYRLFGSLQFEAADTGGGLFLNQVDLYWGEDDPAGPSSVAMAASCPVGVWWIVPVLIAK